MGKAMTVGDPTLESTEIGPLIRPAEIQRVNKWVNDAVKDGARLLSGGRPLSDTCYPATVLLDPPDSSIISQNEIFGPVIFVYSYNNLDEPYNAPMRCLIHSSQQSSQRALISQ